MNAKKWERYLREAVPRVGNVRGIIKKIAWRNCGQEKAGNSDEREREKKKW